MKVLLIEKLRFSDLLRYGISKVVIFYGSTNLLAEVGLKICNSIWDNQKIIAIDFGYFKSIKGVRKNAYKSSELYVEKLNYQNWSDKISGDVGFDFSLVVKKYLFELYYKKFEFFELAIRFLEEKPEQVQFIYVEQNKYSQHNFKKLRYKDIVKYRSSFDTTLLLSSSFVLPIFAMFLGFSKRVKSLVSFKNKVICEVDDRNILKNFQDIFKNMSSNEIAFVSQQQYSSNFQSSDNVYTLGLDSRGRREILNVSLVLLYRAIQYHRELKGIHLNLVRLFHCFVRGRECVINGTQNIYCTFEHPFVYKAVRNELLRTRSNCSVFIPVNNYVTNQYLYFEFMVNYDLVLSAGKHFEDLYPRKQAKTKMFVPAGSYFSNRNTNADFSNFGKNLDLINFKKKDTCILFVSTGICDQTIEIENKLVGLLHKVSELKNSKVILRLKPFEPIRKYRGFYNNIDSSNNNIMVTAGEYDLSDFVGVADLVVTSISTAAYDLAQFGLPVIFVDLFHDAVDEDYLPEWLRTDGFPISESCAFKEIENWVYDKKNARRNLQRKMLRFRKYFAYRHSDFDAYRQCVNEAIHNARSEFILNDTKTEPIND